MRPQSTPRPSPVAATVPTGQTEKAPLSTRASQEKQPEQQPHPAAPPAPPAAAAAAAATEPAMLQKVELVGSEDPRNWSPHVKWMYVALISLAGFISPMGSSIVVPGSRSLGHNYHLNPRLGMLKLLPVSFYVLGLGIGPFLLAPISELKGRKCVYLSSAWVFVVLNLASCFTQRSFVALNVVRFLAGAAGSAGPSLGAGSIADMFVPSERGKAQSLYALGPLLGPVVGNVVGAWVAQEVRSWRWLLGVLTICSFAIAVIFVFGLKETYQPVLLRWKREAILKEWQATHGLPLAADILSPGDGKNLQHGTEKQRRQRPNALTRLRRTLTMSSELKLKLRQAFSRPFRLLFFNPVCAIFSLYLGFCYGIIFLFLTQHPLLFEKREREDYKALLRAQLAEWGIDYEDVRGNTTFWREHGVYFPNPCRRQILDEIAADLPGPGGSFNLTDLPPDSDSGFGSGSGSGIFDSAFGSGSGQGVDSSTTGEVGRDPLPQLPNFGWSLGVSGLSYLGLGAGFLVSALINTFLQDRIYHRLAASEGRVGSILFRSPAEIEEITAARRVEGQAAAAPDSSLASTSVSSAPASDSTASSPRRGDADDDVERSAADAAAGRNRHPHEDEDDEDDDSPSEIGGSNWFDRRGSAVSTIPDMHTDGSRSEPDLPRLGVTPATSATRIPGARTLLHRNRSDPSLASRLDLGRAGGGLMAANQLLGVEGRRRRSSVLTVTESEQLAPVGGDKAVEIPTEKTKMEVAHEQQPSKTADAPAQPDPNPLSTLPTKPTKPSPKKGKPEYRLPLCLLGMCLLPLGLLCFGWSAQARTHWLLPLLGSFFTGMATILCFQTILVFLIDAFVPFSASAAACAVLVRSVLAAAFPLFAGRLYGRIGFGWGSSLLALVAILGIPVPIVLFRYGERLR
ncbi:hypothetical protein V8E36_003636 [Tilletia maclaganii]